MTQAPLDCLCQALTSEFRRDPAGAGAAALLAEYARTQQDWRDYVRWSDERYTRNLVHRTREYELLLLCWQPEQASPIHDHAGQSCWMAVLEGDMEEVHYRAPGAPQAAEACLDEGRSCTYGPSQVAFIDDRIALHLIQPKSGPGVTLHLYAKPIDECRVFEPSTGQVTGVELGYHSVRGEACQTAPAEVRATFAAD